RGRVGEALVEEGWLTRGELELCHLGALFDAACFLFDSPSVEASWGFEPGVRHWLGPVASVGVRRLRREAERRRHLLDGIWPSARFDTAPLCRGAVPPGVAPGRHARRVRPPTGRQCELLDHADGRRTPAELARLLGRSAFATTADVRRLASAGLLTGPDTGCAAGIPGTPGTPTTTPGTPDALNRRVPGAALAVLGGHPTDPAAGPPPSTLAAPDITLLIRVRTLLEARL
ncbi:hypothetical protein ACFVFS_20965, partial [Kitasatospora sp. NPDC057692]